MPQARRSILRTPPDSHGGPDKQAEPRYDFSVNSNPFGPPAALLSHLQHCELQRYPDPHCYAAKQAAVAYHRQHPASTGQELTAANIVFGNGSAELIYRIAACYALPQRRVVVASPSFGEYARASSLYGAKVFPVRVYHPQDVNSHSVDSQDVDSHGVNSQSAGSQSADARGIDVAALRRAIAQYRPALVWLCQPNNPSGQAWPADALADIAACCEAADALLVLDAAYYDLGQLSMPLPANCVQLWSLTKTYCIPGLRVAYAIASAEVAAVLERAAPPWQTSSHAQAAACWSFGTEAAAFRQQSIPALHALTASLKVSFKNDMQALGMRLWPSVTPYFLLEVGDASRCKASAYQAGLRLRDCSSFGLPRWVRLATQQPEANAALLEWQRQYFNRTLGHALNNHRLDGAP